MTPQVRSHNPRPCLSKPRFTNGFTLLELMVGIVVGLIVIGGAIAIYMIVLTGANYTTREARLNQELRVAMSFIVDDIRRAGFWREARAVDFGAPGMDDHPNPFARREQDGSTDTDLEIYPDDPCIMLSYDPTFDDGGQQVFGYRLHGGAVQMLVDPALTSTSACPDDNWLDLTDPATVLVTALLFDNQGSRCFNASRSETLTPIAWETETAPTPACLDTGSGDYDAVDGDVLVESRQINITLVGSHARDPATRINLSESVKVRNNRAFVHRDP